MSTVQEVENELGSVLVVAVLGAIGCIFTFAPVGFFLCAGLAIWVFNIQKKLAEHIAHEKMQQERRYAEAEKQRRQGADS